MKRMEFEFNLPAETPYFSTLLGLGGDQLRPVMVVCEWVDRHEATAEINGIPIDCFKWEMVTLVWSEIYRRIAEYSVCEMEYREER